MNEELRESLESELGQEFDWQELEKGLNTIYLLSSEGEEYVLKVHTNPKNKVPWFRAEPRIYEKVSDETDIPSPEIVYKDLSGESYRDLFYVMEKLDGENPQNIRGELGQEELEEVIHRFGRILGEVHKVQITDEYGIIGYSGGVFGPPDSAEQWNWALEGSMSSWKEITEDEWGDPPEIEFDSGKVKERLPEKPESVLLHSDNRLDNLLVDGDNITGFLDWSHPWSGHRIYDLVKTEYLLIGRDLGEWDRDLDLEKLKEEFYSAYRDETGFERGEEFEELRQIYRYAVTLELAAGFANWGSKLDEKEHDSTREEIIDRLEAEEPKVL
ncbi:MAG: phosphotransferase family protein [Candidatus Nanohalobium sp.]